jgi:hypothetical protein
MDPNRYRFAHTHGVLSADEDRYNIKLSEKTAYNGRQLSVTHIIISLPWAGSKPTNTDLLPG